jgi:catechol 2,3-dioxygenase-like lactoylglutathione lyase family enzyme
MPTVNVRYIVDDVGAAIDFYGNLGFTVATDARPAFAAVTRGDLRLLLSGATSSGGRTLPDGRQPVAGGWNRFQLVFEDLEAEVSRLRTTGIRFESDLIRGPGGTQILIADPSGNLVELFEPAR